jgi:octaprenyl-diphosphate synthase
MPSVDKTQALKQAFEVILEPLNAVEARIREQARAFDPAIESHIAYAIESNGKRLRPALALLAGGVTGAVTPSHFNLAVIVELIHAATLVHDDVLDGAETRRGQPTVNAKWGNSLSVLLGDCLFAHALKLSTQFTQADIARKIADGATEVCTGEIIQTQRRFDLNLPVNDYYRIIEMKTGALFAVSTELGAALNEASPEVTNALRIYGLRLGTAYQIYDDVVDLAGDEARAGKTLGTDLQKGKLTLPVLYLLQTTSGADRDRICDVIVRGNEEQVHALMAEAREAGAVRAAVMSGRRMLAEALDQLKKLPASEYRTSLEALGATLDSMFGTYAD